LGIGGFEPSVAQLPLPLQEFLPSAPCPLHAFFPLQECLGVAIWGASEAAPVIAAVEPAMGCACMRIEVPPSIPATAAAIQRDFIEVVIVNSPGSDLASAPGGYGWRIHRKMVAGGEGYRTPGDIYFAHPA
jgi:hypothetical protein